MSEPPARRGPTLENRLPAEGINSSDEHPLREFAWLIGAGLVTLALIVLLVGWGARWLAPRLPFHTEVMLAERWLDRPAQPQHAARSAALQALAERVAAGMGLPPGMRPVVSYDPAPVVNAYATLGGRIRVFEGLLQKLDSEDALAALLAHEIAHVKHRHVAANAGRGVALALLLGLLSSDAGAAAAEALLGNVTSLALLGYSREQETEADADALAAVFALNGHGGGVLDLFNRLGAAAPETGPDLALLRSHPLTAAREEALRDLAARSGWPMTGPRRPLPAALVPVRR
jgi:beta-barrel assembly-enhancing protease